MLSGATYDSGIKLDRSKCHNMRASSLSVFILASAITLVLNGLANFVWIPACSNALYVFIHMFAVDSTTAIQLLLLYCWSIR